MTSTRKSYLVSLAVKDMADDSVGPWAFYVVVKADSLEDAWSAGERRRIRWMKFLLNRPGEAPPTHESRPEKLYGLLEEHGYSAGVILVIPLSDLATEKCTELSTGVHAFERSRRSAR